MANAKLIFFGEHSVVYGKKAVGMPLKNLSLKINLKEEYLIENKYVKYIKNELKNSYGIDEEIYVEVISNIPESSGLGSSAALAVEITKEFKKRYKLNLDIEKLANEFEKYAHGNPSGIDVKLVLSNNAIIFQKYKEAINFDFYLDAYLLIIDSGIKGSTEEALKIVKDNFLENEKYIDNLGEISDLAIEAIKNKNIELIGNLMKKSHNLLVKMKLSNPKIDSLSEILEKNSLGYKITGAGLGGCLIALVKEKQEAENLRILLESNGVEKVWIQDI